MITLFPFPFSHSLHWDWHLVKESSCFCLASTGIASSATQHSGSHICTANNTSLSTFLAAAMKVVYPFIFNSLSLYVSVCIEHMTAVTLGGQKVLAPLGLEL